MPMALKSAPDSVTQILLVAAGIAAAAGLAYALVVWMAHDLGDQPKVVWKGERHQFDPGEAPAIKSGVTPDGDRAGRRGAGLQSLCGELTKPAQWPQWIAEPVPAATTGMVPGVICEGTERHEERGAETLKRGDRTG